IELAVIVVIGDSHAHAPAAMRQAGFLGDVLEGAVGFLVIKGDHRVTAGAHAFDGGTVDEDDVEPAIVIAIEESSAAAGGIDHLVRFGSSNVDGSEADVLSNVLERGDGRQATAIFLGGRGKLGERNTDTARLLLAGGLRVRRDCESKNEDENRRNREKTPPVSPEHALIVSQRGWMP